jgi:hypothetical protein
MLGRHFGDLLDQLQIAERALRRRVIGNVGNMAGVLADLSGPRFGRPSHAHHRRPLIGHRRQRTPPHSDQPPLLGRFQQRELGARHPKHRGDGVGERVDHDPERTATFR